MTIGREIERLLGFGLRNNLIAPCDVVFTRNAFLDLLGLAPAENPGEPCGDIPGSAAPMLQNILDYCAESGLIEDSPDSRDLMDARLMGLLTPRPSEVIGRFYALYGEERERATDYFYKLCRDVNYIQTERIAKNRRWLAQSEYGGLEITVNLAKPEKDPRDIEKARLAPSSGYPKCLLCRENEGYAGRANHPARQNLRLIPVELCGEEWFFQYSPYVYYNEHCIVINKEHVPMRVNGRTIAGLLDFVELFPRYFIGSNAGLPIVGGSILSHDHYQGGRHVLPIERARGRVIAPLSAFPEVEISVLKWALNVVRLRAKRKEEVHAAAALIADAWEAYSDEELGIFAATGDGERHNAVAPVARRRQNGDFEADLILRNNLTSEAYPGGVFNTRPERFHIKKENIGLIEAMGLAVLPGRLDSELRAVAEILTGRAVFGANIGLDERHQLYKHFRWIGGLVGKYGTRLGDAEAESVLRDEVGAVFAEVLRDCAVFRDDEAGRLGLERFLKNVGGRNKK